MPPNRGRRPSDVPPLLRLPSQLLEAIFALCDFHTRVATLPLVCSTFRRALAGPSATLWPSIDFEGDVCQPGPPPAPLADLPHLARPRGFLRFLRSRGGLTRTLNLDFWRNRAPPQPSPQLRALGQELEDALQAVLGGVEFLRMRWGGMELVVGDWIAAATSLTCLALRRARAACWERVGGQDVFVTPALASLTALEHLELSTMLDDGPELEPGCLPPSITRLCCVPAPVVPTGGSRIPDEVLELPHLDVSESLFLGDHLEAVLPRLSRLTSLAFDKCELPDGVPHSLTHLTCLRVLSFDSCILNEEAEEDIDADVRWSVLGALTGLVSLSLSNCTLDSLPAAVMTLPRLKHLYLEHNALRALPPGPYLRRLQLLSTDWEPLLRSHRLLLEAPCLQKLALGTQSVEVHNADGLPPLGSPEEVLGTLRDHPALREIVLVARAGYIHGAMVAVLGVLLHLAGLRPDTLKVHAVEHDKFFVTEPPADQGEEAPPPPPLWPPQ